MDATRPSNPALIDDDRPPRRAALPTRERADLVRVCFNLLPSPRRPARAYWQEARIGLVGQGDGYVLVEVEGSVDIACRAELTEVLTRAVGEDTPAVIVDLSGATLLAAAGFGCLREAANLLAGRGGCLHLVCPTGSAAARIMELLDSCGWHLHPDLPEAVAAVGGEG